MYNYLVLHYKYCYKKQKNTGKKLVIMRKWSEPDGIKCIKNALIRADSQKFPHEPLWPEIE